MTATATFVLLTCGSVGALAGLSWAFWLVLKVMRVQMGPPSPVGVLLFIGFVVLLTATLVAYLERTFQP